ncbi:MAG: PAS domain S-box protein [Vicinamibacteria bacterium]|nr:PAS domain S-box protein [Vicinamibacteria bacterium]
MRLTRWFGMTARLAAGTTLAVVLAAGTGAYFYSVHHSRRLLENARETARLEGELIRDALEYQMLADDRTLIAKMIDTFGRRPNAEQVALLDRHGVVRFSSVPITSAADFEPGSPTCQACHQFPPAERMDSRVIEARGGAVLRTVIPVMNKPACHQCHDPKDRINGVLMLDVNMEKVRAGMDRDLRWMAVGTAALTLLLVAGIALIVRVAVLRRLQRFETTARLIAGGDLNQRVPAGGSDTISWLAQEFNTMADSMTGLLDQVHGQQRRLETVINSIDDGIVVLDPHRKVIAANDAFLQRTGLPREGVLGCGCRVAGPGACPAGDCPTLVCLSTGQRQVRIIERRMADGTTRWEEVHASPIVTEAGELVQVVEVWRDISDRRAAEARLSESHRLASLGMLASGFSHELNTPLGTVLTCVEGILRDAEGHDAAGPEWSHIGQCASVARDQVLRCRSITQHFLRMSRGQSGGTDIVDLQSTLAAVTRLIEPTARAHGVRIVQRPTFAGLHVRANDAELQHIFINLLLNAIQASAPGTDVTLDTTCGDPMRIRVSDRGCGIAAEHRTRIFEPFFSLRQGGTGLGLFLSLDFARRWGGDITVESEHGAGSVFEIAVPAAASAAARQNA